MAINKSEIKKIAYLAHINISQEEADQVEKKLVGIFSFD